MQSSAIHNPYAGKTPSQIKAAEAHHRRQARIAANAKIFQPRIVEQIEPPPPLPLPPESVSPFAKWLERQERLNPLPKKPWFSIEAELNPAPEPPQPRKIPIAEIVRACAKHYNVAVNDMLSARRTEKVVRPRHVAMYLAKKLTLASLPEIGRRMGGRDHTTVLHGVRKIEGTIAQDSFLSLEVDAIRSLLPGATP